MLKPQKHETLEDVELVSQAHPGITAVSPFEILIEFGGPESELKGDVHYCLQFCVVLSGSVELMFGNWKKIFTQDQIWWTMCWEPHAYRLLSPQNELLVVNINIDTLGSIGPCSDADWLLPFTMAPQDRYCPESAADKAQLRSWAKKMYTLHDGTCPSWKSHCWLLIHQLLLKASDSISKKKHSANIALRPEMSRIQKAVQMVRTQPVPPSLGEAAAACSLSVSRFSVLFSSVMGVSYGQFALRVRLSNASLDVRSGLFTLNEIAERHGFCDASSFCNAFKKIYRCTPREFKDR